MESSVNNRSSPPTTTQFPLNLNPLHHDHHQENKIVMDEMDFFADSSKDDANPTVSTELDFNVNTGLHLLTGSDDGISLHSDDDKTELALLQAELERMNAENLRLKETLNQITNNYNTLQMHPITLMQQHQICASQSLLQNDHAKIEENNHQINGPRQFMDLGLAAENVEPTDEASLSSSDRARSPVHGRDDSPEKGSQWGPNKVSRLSQASKNVDQATEATMRKARVSVRARSEAPMITDGCQWRKYGQKMAKGNPCPRAYYRCTMAAACPVRKQVQRCAEDRTILITTYEGNHNHPLPPAAMAMASTTSSAARLLLSGSMPSADGLMNSNFLATTLLPCSSSMATISASAPFPTVTLDLTQIPNNPLQFQRNPNQLIQFPFPNSSQNNNLLANPAPLLHQIFGQALYNQSKFSGLQMSHDSETASNQPSHQTGNGLPPLHQGQQNPMFADTISALTADPNFNAALASAITSLIGNSNAAVANNDQNVTTTTNNNNGSVTTSNNSNGNNKVINSSFPAN